LERRAIDNVLHQVEYNYINDIACLPSSASKDSSSLSSIKMGTVSLPWDVASSSSVIAVVPPLLEAAIEDAPTDGVTEGTFDFEFDDLTVFARFAVSCVPPSCAFRFSDETLVRGAMVKKELYVWELARQYLTG
jgi:hypothetical protein